MIQSDSQIKVRYDEVDKMGYVYHGNYAKYFHISRTELMRALGLSDSELEKYNVIMPVIELNVKYLKPVFYDDIITIRTTLKEMPVTRMKFHHEVFNPDMEKINEAESTLVFVNKQTRRPMKAPGILLEKLRHNADF